MKKTIFLFMFIMLCLLPMQAHTYVTSSVLKSGKIIKLQVNSTGLYGLSYDQIQALGLNPKKVRILGYGGNQIPQNFTLPRTDDVPSVPFYMQLGSDSVFSSGDYIIFYANGPVGWSWNSSSLYFTHTRNQYADYGCYFISDTAGEQLLLQEDSINQTAFAYDVYSYTDLQLHEEDLVNMLDMKNGKEGGGREWYGEILTSDNPSLSVAFSFTNPDTSKTMMCRVEAVANQEDESSSMSVQVADTQKTMYFMGIPVSDFYTRAASGKANISVRTPIKSSMPVKLTYSANKNAAYARLNWIEMQVPCGLQMKGNYLLIRNTEHVGSQIPSRYHLAGANRETQIWDLTSPLQATIVPTTWQGDTLCWVADNLDVHVFAAVNTGAKNWSSPASRGQVSNQDIHRQIRGAQHIIITPEDFRYAAEQLKLVHERHTPSERWEVVSDVEVYNEFSSGTPDATAYRWLMKYLYDTAEQGDDAPQTLLLFGDGSFDNRKLLSTSPVPYLLTYQAENSLKETDAYGTDDYFGWLEDSGGVSGSKWDDKKAKMQIGVGRLPIRSYEEALSMVDKIDKFLNDTTPASWRQQMCFLADDGNEGTHVSCADQAAEAIRTTAPDFVVNKIYLDSYVQETSASGESYPLAYNTFTNLLQSGVLLMDYAGHGSANNICSEMFLTRKQVENMTNAHQGIWMLATCNFSHFDQTDQSTAEVAVLNNVGGAIAVVSADRTVYASENSVLNKHFCSNLVYHTDPFTYPYHIGDALRIAKNNCGNSSINKLCYLLLGDPSIHLPYPCQYQILISHMPDTLHALDLVTIHGYVSTGDTLSSERRDTVDYTGTLTFTLYDKMQTIATRDNDQPDEKKKQICYFQDYPNKIFMGETSIERGCFTIQFRVPKDIHYNIGTGRITMYATGHDGQQHAEAMGHHEQFKVGGSSSWIIDDKEGPEMTIYLNTPFFRDGDAVNTTPRFFAKLYDENGINTIGSGIGHDLQLVLDNSPKQSYVLNNYYTADNQSYQNGSISYLLPELSDGSHSLTFRAWDMLNNASTQTIGFTVNQEIGPEVKTMLVYPNPVSQQGTINMVLSHDRPDDVLSMDIAFYDLSGQKVWSAYRSLNGSSLQFDMQDAGLKSGTYIYQFTIQTNTQTSTKYTGRLIVY